MPVILEGVSHGDSRNSNRQETTNNNKHMQLSKEKFEAINQLVLDHIKATGVSRFEACKYVNKLLDRQAKAAAKAAG